MSVPNGLKIGKTHVKIRKKKKAFLRYLERHDNTLQQHKTCKISPIQLYGDIKTLKSYEK